MPTCVLGQNAHETGLKVGQKRSSKGGSLLGRRLKMARRVGLAGTVMQCAWEEDRATAPTLSGLPAPRG